MYAGIYPHGLPLCYAIVFCFAMNSVDSSVVSLCITIGLEYICTVFVIEANIVEPDATADPLTASFTTYFSVSVIVFAIPTQCPILRDQCHPVRNFAGHILPQSLISTLPSSATKETGLVLAMRRTSTVAHTPQYRV